uniref:AAR2 splicing factor homolog n=1 Tax=Globisporangium ultimum (strain ATCC 200006 / CBS 805.95 / DAOM BR144) TaxID=431595 RepID=K3W8B9_GLOUD
MDAADIFTRALRNEPPAVAAAAVGANTDTEASGADSSSSAIGGFLVCLDVPQMTEFGVDYEVFRTGPKFQGVKFLPLGIHLVVFRSREQEHGIRQGFFIRVTRHSQVIVREWSAEKEELAMPRPGLNLEHLELLSFQLDSGLGVYPKQHYKIWHRMTKYISNSRCGVELGALILPGDSDMLSSDGDAAKRNESVAPFFPDLPRTVRFTSLLKRKNELQLSAVERTQYYFDRSTMLEELLASDFGNRWEELVGEFQLAFVVFLQLSSLAALEQWKQFIVMLCSCDRALHTHTSLFAAFLKLLHTHLKQIPEDFFDDETTSANFLRPCLASFFEVLDDVDAPQQLQTPTRQLQQLVQTRFGITLSSFDAEEFAPVVVSEEELFAASAASCAAPAPVVDRSSAEVENEAIAAAFLAAHRITMGHRP